jgi:hypothetical protein
MSKKKKNRPSAPTAAQAGHSDAGQEARPSEHPAERASESAGGAVPLGLPIPLEHYKALQEDAKHRKLRHPDFAQEDPGGTADT